jgi:hypothetical protein
MSFIHAAFLAAGLAVAIPAGAGELYTAPFGEGGTWNLYQRIERGVTWPEAMRLAEELKAPAGNPELAGHLVTFSSLAENHFMRQLAGLTNVWCGLTDDERFGGQEAGSDPRKGWKWITGEPLTFSNWKPVEPDDWSAAGEDAVAFDRYGHWTDKGNGLGGQVADRAYFVVEWETRSEKPVEGAIPMKPVLYSGIQWPERVPGKWSARWVSGWVPASATGHYVIGDLWEAQHLLAPDPATSGNPRKLQVVKRGQDVGKQPWLWFSNFRTGQGWLPASESAEKDLHQMTNSDNCVGAIVGTIHIAKPGTYTFAVSAQDAFALRIGGLKWKSSGGAGSIDPLDPLTLTQPHRGIATRALGVMDLQAGDHLVEAVWMLGDMQAEFAVLSAPGAHVIEGDTSDWRPLGHEMSSAKIPRLGVTDAGWKIERTKPPSGPHPTPSLQDGLLALEMDLDPITKSGLPSINFAQSPHCAPAHFPGSTPFAGDATATGENGWVLRASARLVVPQDGLYQVGLHAQGRGALRIKGAQSGQISQAPQGLHELHQAGDTVSFNGRSKSDCEPKLVTGWDLKTGEYDIEIFYVKDLGPASLAVFSSPAGPYAPALLSIGGASLADDLPGLPHSSN